MKRYSLLFAAILVTLVMVSASTCFAVFPAPDGTRDFQMQQGWFEGNLTWFICTDASDIRFAQTHNLTLSPKLNSAFGIAPPLFIVTNPVKTQGPVFSTRPNEDTYSGIWTVYYVTWINKEAIVNLISVQQILDAEAVGDLAVVLSDPPVVVDYPIVALGRLGGSWLTKPDPPFYRIPQGLGHDPYAKTITLPIWEVYCTNTTTKEVSFRKVIIPDVADPEQAIQLGANLAPALVDIPLTDTQRFFTQIGVQPPSQLPIVEYCPEFSPLGNKNFNYSPVQQFTVLERFIAPSTIVNNIGYLNTLLNNGGLVLVRDDQIINAPILPPVADIKVCKLKINIYIFDWFLPDLDKINLSINGQPVLKNFKLPVLFKPYCIPVILNQGFNKIEFTAVNRGLLDSNTLGVLISDPCRQYANFKDKKGLFHLERFSLEQNEKATIIIKAP